MLRGALIFECATLWAACALGPPSVAPYVTHDDQPNVLPLIDLCGVFYRGRHMRRREFVIILGATTAWPLAARAQQPERMRRVGVLMGYAETDLAAQAQVAAFRQELQKLGWDEGRNIRIDVRFPAANADRVRSTLMELTSLTPDVLVSNTDLVTAIVRAEVRTIPSFHKRGGCGRLRLC